LRPEVAHELLFSREAGEKSFLTQDIIRRVSPKNGDIIPIS